MNSLIYDKATMDYLLENDAIISLPPILQPPRPLPPKQNPGGLKTYHEK